MDPRFHPFQRAVEDWHWWYRVRRSILDLLLARLDLDPARSRLLDIGCGTGGSSLVLSRYGQVVALDRAPASFDRMSERPYRHRVIGSAQQLPFQEAAFDLVSALDVLEHLDDDAAAAHDVWRVLKPGGTAVVFVPAYAFLWRKNDEFSHHRRRYTRATLATLLQGAGFELAEIGYFNTLLFFPQVIASLIERAVPSLIQNMERPQEETLMNRLLERTFALEVSLLKRTPLPFGASVYCLAHKS